MRTYSQQQMQNKQKREESTSERAWSLVKADIVRILQRTGVDSPILKPKDKTDHLQQRLGNQLLAQMMNLVALHERISNDATQKDERIPRKSTFVNGDQVNSQQLNFSIQRKELYGRSHFGKLFKGNQTKNPKDWWNIDRLDWPYYRSRPTNNSFIRAVIYNTKHNYSEEFTTVSQRHDYYRVIDFLIQSGQISPEVRDVRFFEAAGMTTDPLGVGGAVQSIGGKLLHSDETERVLKEVNRILLQANMRIIKRLMERKHPTTPQNEKDTTLISTLKFDLSMVGMEQALVQQYLDQHRLAPKVVEELNTDLNSTGFWRTIAPIRPFQFNWAKKAMGVSQLDFRIQTHREAIGRAMVFLLHGFTENQYYDYMRNDTLPRNPIKMLANKFQLQSLRMKSGSVVNHWPVVQSPLILAKSPLQINSSIGKLQRWGIRDWLDWRKNEAVLDAWEDAKDELADFKEKKYPAGSDQSYSPSTGIGSFDAQYIPKSGYLNISVRCEFNFIPGTRTDMPDFEKAMKEKRAPKLVEVQVPWTKKEETDWEKRFMSLCGPTWSGKHVFYCQKDWWESLKAKVKVNFTKATSPGLAPHFKITIHKGWSGERSTAGKWNQADLSEIDLEKHGRHTTATHEAGHMLGLGDEYYEEGKPRLAEHSSLVKAEFGHEVIRGQGNPDSIMAGGSKIMREHGVVFLEALKKVTNIKEWKDTPKPPRRIPTE
jgi:hypothetical protein